jgi:hypothetical protein
MDAYSIASCWPYMKSRHVRWPRVCIDNSHGHMLTTHVLAPTTRMYSSGPRRNRSTKHKSAASTIYCRDSVALLAGWQVVQIGSIAHDDECDQSTVSLFSSNNMAATATVTVTVTVAVTESPLKPSLCARVVVGDAFR